jgi:hypothetical protein
MKRWKRDDGIALVWLAITLVLLIGMAGFGLDLGWIYLNTARAQKAVDAAALAGVVNLPGFILQAESDADDAARANGYDPDGADDLAVTPLADNKLHAELRTQIAPIFLGVLGFDHFNITRESTAEYIKPIPLGSPNNCFGFDPTGTFCSASGPEDFWAAVSGRFTRKQDGDPYSTTCLTNTGPSNCSATNALYNARDYKGYYYGIEVPDVAPGNRQDLEVWIFDARYNDRNPASGETGDSRFAGGGGGPGIATTFSFKDVDPTPLNPSDNATYGSCEWTLSPDTDNAYRFQWVQLCNIPGTVTPGIYVLHVESTGTGAGSNNYSIAARLNMGGGTQPRVYGINEMSIWSNDYVQSSELYLAEIEEIHAGKKLELRFFDPGDADNDSNYSVLDPFGNVPVCSWRVFNHNGTAPPISSGTGACSWLTTDSARTDPETGGPLRVYNNQWIEAIIDLPDDPADMCNGSFCYWKMDLDLSNPTERTTWHARVIGNPVRLVPPEPAP